MVVEHYVYCSLRLSVLSKSFSSVQYDVLVLGQPFYLNLHINYVVSIFDYTLNNGKDLKKGEIPEEVKLIGTK